MKATVYLLNMRAFEKQTHFLADASHELRTSIAIIQGYANFNSYNPCSCGLYDSDPQGCKER